MKTGVIAYAFFVFLLAAIFVFSAINGKCFEKITGILDSFPDKAGEISLMSDSERRDAEKRMDECLKLWRDHSVSFLLVTPVKNYEEFDDALIEAHRYFDENEISEFLVSLDLARAKADTLLHMESLRLVNIF